MTTIKRFTPDYKMHAVRFEAFAREAEHGELVQFDDHQQTVSTLEAERDAQQKRADALEVRLRDSLSSEQEAIQRAHAANQTIDALAVESIGLRHIAERIVNALYAAGYEPEENSLHPWKSLIFDAEKALNTPANDAALAAIRNEASARALKHLCDCQLISATVAELKATELREAK